MRVDTLIMAVGQMPEDPAFAAYETDSLGRIEVAKASLETSRPGVFAAGDVTLGPSSVIEAIASGRKAAESIDRFLGGAGNIEESFAPEDTDVSGMTLEEQGPVERLSIKRRPAAERLADGGDVELTYSEAEAMAEAMRCLRCDLEDME